MGQQYVFGPCAERNDKFLFSHIPLPHPLLTTARPGLHLHSQHVTALRPVCTWSTGPAAGAG